MWEGRYLIHIRSVSNSSDTPPPHKSAVPVIAENRVHDLIARHDRRRGDDSTWTEQYRLGRKSEFGEEANPRNCSRKERRPHGMGEAFLNIVFFLKIYRGCVMNCSNPTNIPSDILIIMSPMEPESKVLTAQFCQITCIDTKSQLK
jgi:hypothetical protein